MNEWMDVDQHLTWNEHINQISTKIAKNIGILSRTSYILPKPVRLQLYYSLVYLYLTYCNMIWASTYKFRLRKLVILQKRAVRMIAGIRRGEHTSSAYLEYNLLRIDQIRIVQIGEFIYRFEHNLLPPIFKSYFSLGSDVHTHYTRNSTAYRPIKARTNTRRFNIKYSGSLIWNTIPLEIRLSINLQTFKKRLRHFLING